MCTDVVTGMELTCCDAIKKWRTCMGPTNPE